MSKHAVVHISKPYRGGKIIKILAIKERDGAGMGYGPKF
jgi:hypothetical protein